MGAMGKMRRQVARAQGLEAPKPAPQPKIHGDRARIARLARKSLLKLKEELAERKKDPNWSPSTRDLDIMRTIAESQGQKWAPPEPPKLNLDPEPKWNLDPTPVKVVDQTMRHLSPEELRAGVPK